jgi:5-methylcytosine-specific restriction endonuclease McrA
VATENTKCESQSSTTTLPTHNELRDLIEAQGYRCALSGAKLTPENAHIDHIHPVSQGGDHSINNLQWVHARINGMKGSMSNEAFIKWCTRVARCNSQE